MLSWAINYYFIFSVGVSFSPFFSICCILKWFVTSRENVMWSNISNFIKKFRPARFESVPHGMGAACGGVDLVLVVCGGGRLEGWGGGGGWGIWWSCGERLGAKQGRRQLADPSEGQWGVAGRRALDCGQLWTLELGNNQTCRLLLWRQIGWDPNY